AGNDDGVAGVEGLEGHPLADAVHERGGGEPDFGGGLSEGGDEFVRVVPFSAVGAVVAAKECDEGVGLVPEDGFGGSGGAAGADDVEIVGGPAAGAGWQVVGGGGEGRFVVDGARQERLLAAVVDLEEDIDAGQAVERFGEARSEGAVVDEGPGSGG